MEIFLIIIIIILLITISVLIFYNKKENMQLSITALLTEKFASFQKELKNDIESTRKEVTQSKDLISEHTIKTIDTIKEMGTTINKIIQQQEDAQKLGESLKDLLQVPKLRGNYGETILEEMLDRVLPKNIWEKQYEIADGKKVDAIVHVKDVIIPIDSKFPRDDYGRYLDSENKDEKARFWKEHENAVKTQIKSISEKYIRPDKGTSDFALMFIPSEAIYYETIAEKNYLGEISSIYDYAQKNHVLPVSPNTFYAFLQVVMLGIKNLEIIKSAKTLQDNLETVKKAFGKFYKKYEDMGKHIDKAAEAYRVGDKHIMGYKKKLDSTLSMDEQISAQVDLLKSSEEETEDNDG